MDMGLIRAARTVLLTGSILLISGHRTPCFGQSDEKLTYADWGLYGRPVSPYYTSEECPFNVFVLHCDPGGHAAAVRIAIIGATGGLPAGEKAGCLQRWPAIE